MLLSSLSEHNIVARMNGNVSTERSVLFVRQVSKHTLAIDIWIVRIYSVQPIWSRCLQQFCLPINTFNPSMDGAISGTLTQQKCEREGKYASKIIGTKMFHFWPANKSYFVLQTRASPFQFGFYSFVMIILLIFFSFLCVNYGCYGGIQFTCRNPLTYSI